LGSGDYYQRKDLTLIEDLTLTVTPEGMVPQPIDETIKINCPDCGGWGKKREGDWVPLAKLEQSKLYELVKLRALVDDRVGTVRFVATQSKLERMSDNELLDILRRCSELGHYMEEQNWLVKY